MAVLVVGLLCVEAAWWQVNRLRLSVALMEAARAVSRHNVAELRHIDRAMHRAFANAWHGPPLGAEACQWAGSPPPCWTLQRVPARSDAPAGALRLCVKYRYDALTPMVRSVLRTTAGLARRADTRAAHARGAVLIRLDLHIEDQRRKNKP